MPDSTSTLIGDISAAGLVVLAVLYAIGYATVKITKWKMRVDERRAGITKSMDEIRTDLDEIRGEIREIRRLLFAIEDILPAGTTSPK